MPEHMPIMIGDDTIMAFIDFCKKNRHQKLFLIADENTYEALGRNVFDAAIAAGLDVIRCVLNPDGLHTDGVSILRVLNAYDTQPRLFVAVGSGTITDITRFASHRSRNEFVSFPTAASVDAYTPKNAAVTIGDLKGSVYCHSPIAIFTDLQTIIDSPKFLTASGFGDLVSKNTAPADWKLTHLLWDAPFDEDIYTRALKAGQNVIKVVDGIRKGEPAALEVMMNGQFEGGFCMADFGNSSPASGSEHHISHIWEMMFHMDHKEGLFHGHAVGVAAIISAGWYQQLRSLSREKASAKLDQTTIPDREIQIQALQNALPQIADEVIASDPIYLQLADAEKWETIKARILEKWEAIQEVAQPIPTPDDLRTWIKSLGGPTTAEELGVSEAQLKIAKDFGLYLRERFSINILRKLFSWT